MACAEANLVATFLHNLLCTVPSKGSGGHSDVLPAEELWDQATPPTWDPEITGGTALVGPGDDWPAKALLLGGEEAVDNEAELLITLDVTLTHEAGAFCPLDATIWKEVHATFELAVAIVARGAALPFRGNGVGTEGTGTPHSSAVHSFPSCLRQG